MKRKKKHMSEQFQINVRENRRGMHTRQRQTKQKAQQNVCWTPNSFRKIVEEMSTKIITELHYLIISIYIHELFTGILCTKCVISHKTVLLVPENCHLKNNLLNGGVLYTDIC
jgi:hypothetical protein